MAKKEIKILAPQTIITAGRRCRRCHGSCPNLDSYAYSCELFYYQLVFSNTHKKNPFKRCRACLDASPCEDEPTASKLEDEERGTADWSHRTS